MLTYNKQKNPAMLSTYLIFPLEWQELRLLWICRYWHPSLYFQVVFLLGLSRWILKKKIRSNQIHTGLTEIQKCGKRLFSTLPCRQACVGGREAGWSSCPRIWLCLFRHSPGTRRLLAQVSGAGLGHPSLVLAPAAKKPLVSSPICQLTRHCLGIRSMCCLGEHHVL